MLLINRCFIARVLYNGSILYDKVRAMITKDLGNRIKELRKKAGLSQERFAMKIEMDRTYFASVEAGRRNISIINIKKIADGLGVTLHELFEGL